MRPKRQWQRKCEDTVVTSLQFVNARSFGQSPLTAQVPSKNRASYEHVRKLTDTVVNRSKLFVNSRITDKWHLLGMQVSDT
jgi:hypothetical protein